MPTYTDKILVMDAGRAKEIDPGDILVVTTGLSSEQVAIIETASAPDTNGEIRYVEDVGFQFFNEGTVARLVTSADSTKLDALTYTAAAGGNPAVLSFGGKIESTTGGFKFPDGTTQTTAASGSASAAGGTGAVQFADGTSFAADAANLFWDDTNNRLGIGKNNPATALDVNGTVTATAVSTTGLDGATVTIGGTTATSVTLGRSGQSVISAGNLKASDLDTNAAGALTVGGTTATSVSLGRTGQTLTLAGNVTDIHSSAAGIDILAYGVLELNSSDGNICIGCDTNNSTTIYIAVNSNRTVQMGNGSGTTNVEVNTGAGHFYTDGASFSIDSTSASNISVTGGNLTLSTITSGVLAASSAGALDVDAAGALSINSSAGAINVGNDAVEQNINIGTGAAERNITLGNATGATSVTIRAGSGDCDIIVPNSGFATITAGYIEFNANDDSYFWSGQDLTLQCAVAWAATSGSTMDLDAAGALSINSSAAAINIGNDAVAQAINVGTGAAARTITIGNTTGATGVVLDVGSGKAKVGADEIATLTASQTLSNKTLGSNLAAGTYKITGLGDPSSAQDAATKAYVDSVAQGLDVKASVRAATTASGTLASDFANGSVVDGVTLATGDRILLKNQSTASQNGIYVVAASGAPARSSDMDAAAEFPGAFTFVEEGTTNADTGWVCITNAPITVGSTSIAFAQFSGAGTYSAGTGLTLTGTSFSIDTNTTVDKTTAQTLTNKTLTSPTLTTPSIGDATATSVSRTGGNLSVSTVTSGTLSVSSAGALDIDAVGAVAINTSASPNPVINIGTDAASGAGDGNRINICTGSGDSEDYPAVVAIGAGWTFVEVGGDLSATHLYSTSLQPLSSSASLTLDSTGSGSNIYIGTTASARTITIGNTTGATGVVLNVGSGKAKVGSDEIATLTASQTLTNKTLTTPKISDSSGNTYNFAVNDLTADRTITLPLLTGNDTFVFADHTQTLTGKTLTSPKIADMDTGTATTMTIGGTNATTITIGRSGQNVVLADTATVTGQLTHTVDDKHTMVAAPSAPAAGSALAWYENLAGRALPAFRGPSGRPTYVQPSIFGTHINHAYVGTSTVTQALGCWSFTANGTASRQGIATTGKLAASTRLRFTTTAAANAAGGVYTAQDNVFVSSTADLGGFFFYARVGWDSVASGARIFVGFSTATTAGIVTSDPSATANSIGLGKDSGDTNYQLLRVNSSGTITKSDLGFAPATNDLIEVYLWAAPGSTTINAQIYDVTNTTTRLAATAYTDGPAASTLLRTHIMGGTGSGSSAVQFCYVTAYLETYL